MHKESEVILLLFFLIERTKADSHQYGCIGWFPACCSRSCHEVLIRRTKLYSGQQSMVGKKLMNLTEHFYSKLHIAAKLMNLTEHFYRSTLDLP